MYVILGHSQNQYLPIRVSNHRSLAGFKSADICFALTGTIDG